MHFSVPIECLAASGETSTGICAPEIALLELDLEVGTDCKLQVSAIGSFDECVEQHGALEYYWGLRPGDLRIQTNTQSTIHLHPSMKASFGPSWTLIPTEEMLHKMASLQESNRLSPIRQRRHFSKVFCAPEYEYIFFSAGFKEKPVILPDFCHHFCPPYSDLPVLKSAANPFFVSFHCRLNMLLGQLPPLPESHFDALYALTDPWFRCVPDEFFDMDSDEVSDGESFASLSEDSDDDETMPLETRLSIWRDSEEPV